MMSGKRSKSLRRNLGKRNQAVVPVGAWVELASSPHCGDCQVFTEAQIEEERMKQRQQEKQQKLAQFQKDVKDRVRQIHQMRREQQLEMSSQAVNLQQRILHRGQRGEMGKRQQRTKMQIYREGSIQIGSDGDANDETGQISDGEIEAEQLTCQSQKIGQLVKMAKRDLAGRKIMLEKTNIPGGTWGQSFTRDRLTQSQVHNRTDERVHSTTASSDNQPPGDPTTNTFSSYDVTGEVPSSVEMSDPNTRHFPLTNEPMHKPKSVTFDPNLDRVAGNFQSEDQNKEGSGPVYERKQQGRVESKIRTGRGLGGRVGMVDVKPGVVEEERRRQLREEVSMFRRLFMDMERENVQENARRKQHNKRILRLKKAKEEERFAVERKSEQAVEPKNPETGQTEAEMIEQQREDERRAEAAIEKQKKKEKRERETERQGDHLGDFKAFCLYIYALRAQMKEKIEKLGVTLPPLCACGATAWDCSPDTCANNCVFYRNPKGKSQAVDGMTN
ncbi:Coiled-coil domain-containing protein 15 [Holothuria leucospilota]|uniref:Coiled-coil domain-containing protein 15 n=1 Tax=Holothuria leucospilota TaxID=206669 RepID=A0A9Q1H4B1_HOLLE|nr:Coiled-coil domain-containing protein 15 [Holothuria leucospilota]